MIPRPVQIAFGLIVAAIVTVTPFLYQSYHNSLFRNVREVKEGVLYRSAQLSTQGLKRLIIERKIKTVICLRDGEKKDDQIEESYCLNHGIQFVRLAPQGWWTETDGSVPVEDNLARFREVMKDKRNHPVLLHCFAGIHRTGSYVAIYRMDFEGWSNEKALTELRARGYDTLDSELNVFGYLSNYKAPQTTAIPVSRTK